MTVATMAVQMPISMIVPVVGIGFPVGMRVFIKDQGLHGDRDRVGGHAYAAQVNEIKTPERDAIDHQ